MAGTGIMALLASKPKGGGSKGPPAEGGEAGAGDMDAEIGGHLRDMFDALKAGNDAEAGSHFHMAYEACSGMHSEPDADEMGGESDEDADNLDL